MSGASDEFNKLWDDSVHVLPKDVTDVTKNSFLRDDLTPHWHPPKT